MGSKLRKFKLFIGLFIWTASFAVKSASNEIVFSSDLPLDSYQPATIIAKLEKAFAMSGVKFSTINLPSNRSLALSNEGVIDGEISRVGNLHEVTNHKYSNLVRIEHKVLSVWISVFSNQSDIEVNSTADLKNYSVCFINGRKYFDDVFEPIVKPSFLIKVNSDLQAFNLLQKNRVDLVITTSVEGEQLIKQQAKFADIREVKKLIELPIYAYINKKHAALLPELTANLAKVERQLKE